MHVCNVATAMLCDHHRPNVSGTSISIYISGETKLLDDPYNVYFAYEGAADTMEQFPCKIMMVQESYNQQFWAFGLAKNSSLTKVFNHRVFVARQSGIWFSEFNKVRGIKDKGPCQASDGNKGGRYVHHHPFRRDNAFMLLGGHYCLP